MWACNATRWVGVHLMTGLHAAVVRPEWRSTPLTYLNLFFTCDLFMLRLWLLCPFEPLPLRIVFSSRSHTAPLP